MQTLDSAVNATFYINYEECKLVKEAGGYKKLSGFILTMRNVNCK